MDIFSQSNTIIVVGIAAGVLTSVSMMPQIYKSIQTKKAENVSPLMLIILIAGVSLWVAYGFMKKDLPIICTNSFSVLINMFMLYLRWRYRKN